MIRPVRPNDHSPFFAADRLFDGAEARLGPADCRGLGRQNIASPRAALQCRSGWLFLNSARPRRDSGTLSQHLVNSQPGWLHEENAVLHPWLSVFDADRRRRIPSTDNRSPSFGLEIEAGDIQSLSIYTAGIPAEYR